MSDLVADCRLAAKCLKDAGEFETGQSILEEAADRIEQLEAQLAAADALAVVSDRIANWTIGGMLADDPKVREQYPHLSASIMDLRAALTAYREARK